VPCGFSSDHLPIGLQILGPHFREDLILRIAYQFEQATPHLRSKPKIANALLPGH
jgi:aspartyl-tRNA(Asn)/glutamyl-tRNA(Gln) amidotransferase subunit A